MRNLRPVFCCSLTDNSPFFKQSTLTWLFTSAGNSTTEESRKTIFSSAKGRDKMVLVTFVFPPETQPFSAVPVCAISHTATTNLLPHTQKWLTADNNYPVSVGSYFHSQLVSFWILAVRPQAKITSHQERKKGENFPHTIFFSLKTTRRLTRHSWNVCRVSWFMARRKNCMICF